MPDKDNNDSRSGARPDLWFEPSQRAKVGLELLESTGAIVVALRLRLAELRKMDDERSAQIAAECQEALEQIVRHIEALIEDRRE